MVRKLVRLDLTSILMSSIPPDTVKARLVARRCDRSKSAFPLITSVGSLARDTVAESLAQETDNGGGVGRRILSDFGPQMRDHWHVGLAHRLSQEHAVPGGVGIADHRRHRRIPQHRQVFSPRAHDEGRRVVPGHQEQR